MPNSGAIALGVLYTGIEDNKVTDESSSILTRSELEQLEITGAPVFVEHDYDMDAVGTIHDAWIDANCKVWIATELFGEDKLGASLSGALNKAVRGGILRDFSIGLDAVRIRGSGNIQQKWLEASLVNEGKYKGTHITVRGSANTPDGINQDSVVTKYLGTRDAKNTYLKVFPEMSVAETAPASVKVDISEMQTMDDHAIATRHIELVQAAKDKGVQFELKDAEFTQASKELEQLKAAYAQSQAANAQYKAKEEKELEIYRKSQEKNAARYAELLKANGASEEETAGIVKNMVNGPNAVWKSIVASMDANDESAEKLKKFQEHVAVTKVEQQHEITMRASKRARSGASVDEMFARDTPKDDVPLPASAVHFPTNMTADNSPLWEQILSAANSSSVVGMDKKSVELTNMIQANNVELKAQKAAYPDV